MFARLRRRSLVGGMGEADRGKMEVQEAPATPTGEFRAIDDTGTFEIFDGNSAIHNRKRRRSSLRRVSFAEQPSIHVFTRDCDHETPPEGTMSHLSAVHVYERLPESAAAVGAAGCGEGRAAGRQRSRQGECAGERWKQCLPEQARETPACSAGHTEGEGGFLET